MDLRVLERPLIRGCAVVVSKCQQSALFNAGLLERTTRGGYRKLFLGWRWGKGKAKKGKLEKRYAFLGVEIPWISAFQLASDSFGDVTAFLLTQPAYTFCNTRRKRKKEDKTSSSSEKKNLSVLSSLCNQEAAFFTSCLNTWSSWTSGHCGYYGEVEALIHPAAEVDNKCVIEKGPTGARGRATRWRNTEWYWSEGKRVSESQLTESSTRRSGTNPVTRPGCGAI